MNGTIQTRLEWYSGDEVLMIAKKILGTSGLEVSAMGLGGWAMGGPFLHPENGVLAYGTVDDRESIKAIRRGYELGVTLFDTANVYGCGRSEQVLGEAVKEFRTDIVIATKFGSTFDKNSTNPDIPCQITGSDASRDGIIEACKASLDRLQTDYIDLYQLHSGGMALEKVQGVTDTLDHLVDEGLIRTYGWSTDDPERASAFARKKNCSAVQFRHNMFSHNYPMIEKVIGGFNVSGLIKGPLGYGFHTGKYKDDTVLPSNHMWHGTNFGEGDVLIIRKSLEDIQSVVTEDGRSLAQAALGWIWGEHDALIPIPGFKNTRQVEENAKAMEYGSLKESQRSAVKEIVDDVKMKLKK